MTILVRVGLTAALLAALVPLTSYAADVNVTLTNGTFEAKHITIYKNDKVTWTNSSDTPHTVTSDTGLFNSGQLVKNQSYWRTFPQTGVFPYYSASRGAPNGVGMAGTVSVIEQGAATNYTPAPTPTNANTTGAAASAASLQAQIADLIARITLMQQQYAGGTANPLAGTGSGAINNTGVSAAGQCFQPGRTLRRGSSGDDVSKLQTILAQDSEVYPEQIISGYFGALTEAAVQRFQCNNNIVCSGDPATTGYGVVGPRTAALLAARCTGGAGGGGSVVPTGPNVGGFIRVTPTTGAAPLNIVIEANLNTTRSCEASLFRIDFGDGTAVVPLSVPANTCAESMHRLTHVYAAGGKYTIKLKTGIHETSAEVVVTGSGSASGDSFNATPGSGAAPLNVTFKGTINAAGVCNAGPYTIAFGDGESALLPVSDCVPHEFTVAHVYATQGNFTVQLKRATTDIQKLTVSVFQTAGTGDTETRGGSVSLSSGIGGNPATIQASFSIPSACMRFELDWGDGSAKVSQEQGTCAAGSVTKTYSRTYQAAGTYTFTLKRGSTLQFTDSASITISQ